jgi:hypothetical protein
MIFLTIMAPLLAAKTYAMTFLGTIKAYAIPLFGLSMLTIYFKKKHEHDQKLFMRMNEIIKGDVKLSGVYLNQRNPFGMLGMISWLLPYHQSLVIVSNGNTRHVGLASSKVKKGFFDRTSEFTLHHGEKYRILNSKEISYPIECWVDYEKKYGHFPENIDPEVLNRITMTRDEAKEKQLPEDDIRRYTFANLFNGELITCRSVSMNVIREAEEGKVQIYNGKTMHRK